MDLLKTPSVQSLLDSDLESVESLHCLDIEELDEVEYALPASEAPTLAEVLSTTEEVNDKETSLTTSEPSTCSPLQVDFLQAISQQLIQAQERSWAGAATALSVGTDGKLTVGTAHGHLLSFSDQILRWVCDVNTDRGAVSCLAYNKDSTRLLAGYARGLICQFESVKGTILRRVTLGGDLWGTLRVTWAGTSGLALDTGGSVWLIKFSRPLGVRSARTSCLFSGARGEVVAMAARDARILALATLSRVIVVAGGRAAGMRLNGPPDTLPVLEWAETDDRMLVCARALTLHWLSLNITGSSISLRPVQRVELKYTPLWLGWLGGNLAIFDADENLRLWGDDYDKPLDLSHIELVYASAFFKGHWTDGRVSRAMCTAGVSALGGACVIDGVLYFLGRRGIVRVKPRDVLTRAQALLSYGRHLQALKLLCSTEGVDSTDLAKQFVLNISERPHVLNNKQVADQTVMMCLKFNLRDELWGILWDQCSNEKAFVEALGDAAVRGELDSALPSPDLTQALIERLADFEPSLVERVLASLPLTAIDPHRASVFTREKGLWRGVGAIAAALGGSAGAMQELSAHTRARCGAERPGACSCAGAALHEAGAAVRLLEQSAREAPFVGPLGKQNRLRVARALLAFARDLPDASDRTEILEFLSGQINMGSLPPDQEVIKDLQDLAARTPGERADRAWVSLLTHTKTQLNIQSISTELTHRPRVTWRINAMRNQHDDTIKDFFKIDSPSNKDFDEFFEYLRPRIEASDDPTSYIQPHLSKLIELRPKAMAILLGQNISNLFASILTSLANQSAIEFGDTLREMGKLRGDTASAHLRNLCTLNPSQVRSFLLENPGILRPEDALAIVRENGPQDAVPICLEAAGDASEALDALLRLAASSDQDAAARYKVEAGELCARVSPTVPPNVAADMWTRLFRSAGGAPPALLLEAITYLPVDETLGRTCETPEVALAILACAVSRHRGWKCAARIAGREAHEALARALVAAGRGVAVRGRCVRCDGALAHKAPVLTTHCARAVHAECGREVRCARCGQRTPEATAALPRAPRCASPAHATPPQDFALVLAAPPIPDLEGNV
ncbi:hypothetical protein O3G_MSEX014241 [Manduca sexta]|uniref:Vacuolar protein sorting-associated protein 8 homolog n=1 Tax=Manduca sexta TaxID=7130 RepID=A0A921ZUU8_MANSE|nr:hypothetical protein O3G_MSEX014241 [Manduca sexta]KAG6464049.1 hypothetical protein O3G_MSEX014241 [Manduca sexta]